MSTVRVAFELLEDAEQRMRRLSVDYGLAVQHRFSAPAVDESYARLNSRWVEHQNNISSTMDGIATVLRGIREAYEQLETQMVTGLQSQGSNAS